MNKQYEYRGRKFTIRVELNWKNEVDITGDDIHQVTSKIYGTNYETTEIVPNRFLENMIFSFEKKSKQDIDNILDGKSTPRQILSKMGFK